MERPKFKWCREVTEQVRFKPDRDKIWDELIAHIEDRTEDMKSRGYTEEEAESRAVAAMGDPAEVGRQLNAVHKPWLGWLWIVSKVLVILTLIVSVFLVYPTVRQHLDQLKQEEQEFSRLSPDNWAQNAEQVYVYRPDQSEIVGGYSLTLDEVTWWRGENALMLDIRISTHRNPFQAQLSDLLGHLYFRDNNGVRFEVGLDGGYYDPESKLEVLARMWTYDPSMANHPLRGEGAIVIYGWNGWEPESLELCIDYCGRTITFRIPGPGGEGP